MSGPYLHISLFVYDQVQNGRYQRVDIMHQYVSPNGHLDGHWADAKEKYRGVMRDPDNINFVTVMREPRSHFIRYLLRAQF